MTITIEITSRVTRLRRGSSGFLLSSVPPVMRPPRIKWGRGEAAILGDAETHIRAALDTPEISETLGRAVQSAIDEHRARQRRATLALVDKICKDGAEAQQ